MARQVMYEVIYDDLSAQITSGALAPNDRLPSEAELAEKYGVSRMTVRQALGQLESEHRLVRRRGAGTFVADGRAATYRRVNKLVPFKDDLGLTDRDVRTQVLVQEVVAPPEEVRQRLALKPRQQAVHLRRLRIVESSPASVQDSWVPYAAAPGLARGRLLAGSLYRTLAERCGIELVWAEQEVTACAADVDLAVCLRVPEGAPLLRITRRSYADGPDPVEHATSYTLPRFPLLIRLER